MKVKIPNELLIINLLIILLIAFIFLAPDSIFRVILGVPFLLFFPGYALISLLYPRKNEPSFLERFILSLGLSIVIIALCGIILNFTGLGINLDSMLFTIAGLTIIMSAYGAARRASLPKGERAEAGFNLSILKKGRGFTANFLSILLAIAVIGSLGVFGYVLANSESGEYYTEFYVLGKSETADNYPVTFFIAKEGIVSKVEYNDEDVISEGSYGEVTLGIICHEDGLSSYSISILADGNPIPFIHNGSTDNILLDKEESWQGKFLFAPASQAPSQKIEFMLYLNGVPKFDSPPYIWVNVVSE